MSNYTQKAKMWLLAPKPIATLAFFRIFFGSMMLFSTLRFISKGWIESMFIVPTMHFKFYGFEWVKALPPEGMYAVFFFMILSAIGIMLGYLYRLSAISFFLLFTYVELLDQSNYLNHYYFVSLVALIMCFLPANGGYALDLWRNRSRYQATFPAWMLYLLQFQLGVVYFYAGIAKIHPEWLLDAMPLGIWLPANNHLPIIGAFLDEQWVIYAFSWGGMFYDILVPFALLHARTRPIAYFAVIVFHLITGWLFPIGMFPYIMIGATLIFFPASLHQKLLAWLPVKSVAIKEESTNPDKTFVNTRHSSLEFDENHTIFADQNRDLRLQTANWQLWALGAYVMWQLLMPLRFVLYPNDSFWTEQGYRFAWRVMLTEKAGTAVFKVTDPKTGQSAWITNRDYLTPQQEKMMSFQPDMLLQFAHHLREEYQEKGIENPKVTVQAHVSYNGRRSQLLIDPTVDLGRQPRTWKHDDWILPLNTEVPKLVGK